MQLFLDDIGWMHGWNRMELEEPSRTGLPRKHVLEDYKVINGISKSVNMKICVALALGEWDKDNLLRDVPNSNPLGKAWDSSKYLDVEKAQSIRDYADEAEYIDFALHGLLHQFWVDGERLCPQEFFYPENHKKHAPLCMADETYIRTHLDTFFAIYKSWGFTKPIQNFASPGGCTVESWKTNAFTRILKDYGIRYWCNNSIAECCVGDGIIKNPKITEIVPWETYDVDPKWLPTYKPEEVGIMGGHWPNVLRFQPENNMERVEDWKAFFLRNAETFGVMLSRDISFAHFQQLYKQYCHVQKANDTYTIDTDPAKAVIPPDMKPPLYISVRNGKLACDGGSMTIYEEKKDFVTYQIVPQQTTIMLY